MYIVRASRPGGQMNKENHHLPANAKIGEVSIRVFRKWFGHNPTKHWHVNGFMAQSEDKHKNRITVDQLNYIAYAVWPNGDCSLLDEPDDLRGLNPIKVVIRASVYNDAWKRVIFPLQALGCELLVTTSNYQFFYN